MKSMLNLVYGQVSFKMIFFMAMDHVIKVLKLSIKVGLMKGISSKNIG